MTATRNPLLMTDSYKHSHWRQNPPGTTRKNSYIEARGGAFGYTVMLGLQRWLQSLRPVTPEDVDEAREVIAAHMGPGVFDLEGMRGLVGRPLPLVIEALSEGTIVPHGTPMVQVRNTDPGYAWLPAFIETSLLRAVWYPSTVAALSREIKVIMRRWLDLTSADGDTVLPYMLHDFGARGVSSGESAAIGGMAHLVNFRGSDTLEAIAYARDVYGEPMAGASIPASEHSTVTCWGRDGEAGFVRQMLGAYGGIGRLVAVVGDSYDVYAFASDVIGGTLREEIAASGGRVVVRPDSGDPVHVVSEVMRLLMSKCGAERNSKGYWVLPPWVRVIQGDGVDMGSIDGILGRLAEQRVSAENIAFGMGGALLQKVNRDTCRFAMKTSAAEIDGVWRDVFKQPITDKGKASKAGVFDVSAGMHVTTREYDTVDTCVGLMRPVWRSGEILVTDTFNAVRERAALVVSD